MSLDVYLEGPSPGKHVTGSTLTSSPGQERGC